jgi:hypothetical protein
MDLQRGTVRDVSTDVDEAQPGHFELEVITEEGFVTRDHYMFSLSRKQLEELRDDIDDTLNLGAIVARGRR